MRTNQEMMQSVLCYIEEHLDGELTLDTIGAFTGYSPYHVHKLFTAICGMPLHAYIRRRQVSKGPIGIVRPEAERTSNEDAFYFKIDIPKLLSIMSFRDADAYVAGINDLVNGNEEYGVMSAAEKMERGRVAVGELAR